MSLNESVVEDAALAWFGDLGYGIGHGLELAPGEPAAERDSFGEVVLLGRLCETIRRLNPAISEEAREDALRKVLRVGTPSLTLTNRAFLPGFAQWHAGRISAGLAGGSSKIGACTGRVAVSGLGRKLNAISLY
jgi:hypothetical protein